MKTTDYMRDESLEQVAAYVGYRPWREFCAMQDAPRAAVVAELEALRAWLRVERQRTVSEGDVAAIAMQHAFDRVEAEIGRRIAAAKERLK